MANQILEVEALRSIAAELEAQVEQLKPLEGKLAAAFKTIEEQNAQIADQKKELGALRGQVNQFKGKMPLDQEEIQDLIKSAIDEAFKEVKVTLASAAGAAGAAAAGAAEAAEEAAEQPVAEEEEAVEEAVDEFGFGPSMGGEFGF